MVKIAKSAYYKLRRFEAQMLANYARSEKKMDLPNGWVTFYRLSNLRNHSSPTCCWGN